jgi:DNA polymerase III subunit delta'
MSRRSKASDTPPPEADRIEGQPHPRETYRVVGQEAALARAAHAIRGARVPSAWLITGPPGVGKATLAYTIARYLLRYGASAEGPADLAMALNDPVSKLIEARAHPGLLVLSRRADDKGKLPTRLKVDEVRRLSSFFGLTASAGGWRVAVLDTDDDMNEEAANALLKNLEEPPPRGVLLVLAHAPGRLLPTIRSRCQRLDLRPFDDETLRAELAERLPELKEKDRAVLAQLAEGSLGLALRLASEEGLELAREAERLLEARGTPDIPAILALADRIMRGHDDALDHFGQFLCQAVANRVRKRAESGQGVGLDRWVEVWGRLNALFARADGLHLDSRQTVLASALALNAAKRQSDDAL